MNEYAMNEYVTNEYVAMNVYAAQEADVDGVVEAVAAVAEPITDRASAAPVSSLPIIKKEETKFRFHTYKSVKKVERRKRKLTSSSSLPISSLLQQLPSSSECSSSLSLVVNTIVLLC